MNETNRKFELRFTGENLIHPNGGSSLYRSDDMIGQDGRLLVSSLRTDEKMEVPYGKLSGMALRNVVLDGAPVARVRRALNGNIVGVWVEPAPQPASEAPPSDAQQTNQEAGTAAQSKSRAALAALRWAGQSLGRSAGSALRTPSDAPAGEAQQPTQASGSTAQPGPGAALAVQGLRGIAEMCRRSENIGLQTMGMQLSRMPDEKLGQLVGKAGQLVEGAIKKRFGGPSETPSVSEPARPEAGVEQHDHPQAHASAPLQGTYYTISANPAFPQYQTSREFRFERSGRFTKGGSSGGTVAVAGTSPGAVMEGRSSTQTGRYEVQQGYLILRYDNGHVERFRLGQESGVIWLDNTPFMRTSG